MERASAAPWYGGESFLVPRIERALRFGGDLFTWPDVARVLAEGGAQFWGTPDGRGCLITELREYPRARTVNYWIAAGELDACKSLVPRVERWAIGRGVTIATGIGRPGFARVLDPRGVSAVGIAYQKDLRS